MGLKTNVLLFQVATLHEARYGAGMGVEIISLPLGAKEQGKVPLADFNEIKGWLEGVKVFAEVDQLVPFEDIKADGWLVSSPEIAKALSNQEKPVGLHINISDKTKLLEVLNNSYEDVSFFVITNASAISNLELNSLAEKFSIYFHGELSTENVLSFIDEVKPKGLAFTGAEEIKTGVNDFEELADILEVLDTDEFA